MERGVSGEDSPRQWRAEGDDPIAKDVSSSLNERKSRLRDQSNREAENVEQRTAILRMDDKAQAPTILAGPVFPSFWSPGRIKYWAKYREEASSLSTPELIENLRDDNKRYNACTATAELADRIRDEAQRFTTRNQLELALDSTDRQQRFLALGLLQSFSLVPESDGVPYYPPDRMLDVCVESTCSWNSEPSFDRVPHDISNEKTVAFLLAFFHRLEPRLVALFERTRVNSRRFLCAYVLTLANSAHHLPLTAPVLIPHLADNYESNDALMAMTALYAAGPMAIAYLPTGRNLDPQMSACINLLTAELRGAAATPEEREERDRMTSLTIEFDNPLGSWSFVPKSGYLEGFTNGL